MDECLQRIRDLIQEDIGKRGLATDPEANLLTECADDFAAACRSIAEVEEPTLAIVTGFFIPNAQLGETDGPLGALFLARALVPLDIHVILVTDQFCLPALKAGLQACHLEEKVPLGTWSLPLPGCLTHLIALERAGPNYDNRCLTMRGLDITEQMDPVHKLFHGIAIHENPMRRREERMPVTTIGIGDGGNEIGMGKIGRDIIGRNIPRGELVACRVPTDHLIVCGISNWGAYGLAAGVRLLRGESNAGELFDPEKEREMLQIMVERGPLVDGVTGQQTATVDGIDFERYGDKLRQLANISVGRVAGEH